MVACLKAMLERLIDYAGMFPPARLPFAEALALYESYSSHPDSWMLGRFICPVSRLDDFQEKKVPCSVLGQGGDTMEAFLAGLDADLAVISRSSLPVEGFEVKLPALTLLDRDRVRALLEGMARRVQPFPFQVFLEGGIGDAESLGSLLDAMKQAPFAIPVGFKLRAGGLEAAAFPSAESLATAVYACVRRGVPFKATAGLHHPMPRKDSKIGVTMHGFINLFMAGVLAQARDLGPKDLVKLLRDDHPIHFSFTSHSAGWLGHRVSLDEIRTIRASTMISFGSCSFDEPRDDLRQLGWLGDKA
ncbi:MAG: hypothetical protein ACKO23_03055 [Gemmataceae bacterium]